MDIELQRQIDRYVGIPFCWFLSLLSRFRRRPFARLTADGIRAIRKMRALGVDTVLDCELFSRVSSIFAYLSCAAVRVGFHPHTQEGLYRGSFINRPVLYNPHQHIARQFLTLAEAIESTGSPRVKRPTESDDLRVEPMAVDRNEIVALGRRLQADFPSIGRKRLVLVNPGGGLLPIRAWPIESFSDVARALIEKGYAVGITGMERDREIARRIKTHCGSESCVDLTGYTATVRELMVLSHLASLLITNDGGPGHFASMTSIPSIIFYGPESPALYGPLDETSTSLFTRLSCSPCLTAYNHRKSPCDGDNRCLKLIESEAVIRKTFEILESEND